MNYNQGYSRNMQQNQNQGYYNQQNYSNSQQNYSYNQQISRPQSLPNASSNAVALPNALQKIKQIHKNLADDVIKTVENATLQEREAVKQAIQNLRNKEKKVMESSDIKQKVEKMETIGDQLEHQMSQIKIAYNRAVRELKRICSSQEEFFSKLKDLDEKMEEALLNEEEKKMMKAIKAQIQSSLNNSMGGKFNGNNVRMIMM